MEFNNRQQSNAVVECFEAWIYNACKMREVKCEPAAKFAIEDQGVPCVVLVTFSAQKI